MARADISLALLCATIAGSAAAAQRPDSTPPHPHATAPRTPPGRPLHNERIGYVDSLREPESVIYDSTQHLYFISNIDGGSLTKDGRGFLSKVDGNGRVIERHWVESGRNGVMLNAPKGMALRHDTLWVTDIDVVRGFNTRTGAPVANIDLAPLGAVFLNDMAFGPDGSLYVTDTRMKPEPVTGALMSAGPSRVFRLDRQWRPSIALESARIPGANGIAWDAALNAFVIVPLAGDTLMTWKPGSGTVTPLATGPGQFDGLVVSPAGILVASKATGSVHRVDGRRLGRLVEQLGDVADMDYNDRDGTLAIAITGENRVVFYRVPPSVSARRKVGK